MLEGKLLAKSAKQIKQRTDTKGGICGGSMNRGKAGREKTTSMRSTEGDCGMCSVVLSGTSKDLKATAFQLGRLSSFCCLSRSPKVRYRIWGSYLL